MNLSQPVAGRSRNVNATRDFCHLREDSGLPQEDSGPKDARTSSAPVVALPWKSAIFGRIRGALRGQRHHVMEALVRICDATDATCWVAMETLAREARVDVKTARKHVHSLVKAGGFLKAESMTWAQLCAHRRAAGRRVPHQDNDRNAPYLFTVLDGVGRRGCDLPETERGQHFGARWGRPPRRAQGDRRRASSEPKTRDLQRHEGYQIWQGRGLPNLAPELSDDPSDQEMSVLVPTSGTDVEQHTSLVISSKGGDETWMRAWEGVLGAYAKHFQRVYEAPPMTPRGLKANDPREAGEHLTSKARTLAELLTVLEQDALAMLTDRTLAIWLDRKGSKDFLARESHPLWALLNELPARTNQAFKALVQEHKAKSAPKQAEPKPVKRAETPADLLEHIRAAREANQFVQTLGTTTGDFVSRPSAQPTPEKPAEVSRPERRIDASTAPNESVKAEPQRNEASSDKPVEMQDEPAVMPERSKAPRPALPRRNEALPAFPRPESVRSGPRWGEVDHRPVRMRRTWAMESTQEAEPDEPVPIE